MNRLLLIPFLLLASSALAGAPRTDRPPIVGGFADHASARATVGDGVNVWAPAPRSNTYQRVAQTLASDRPPVIMDRRAFEGGALPPAPPPGGRGSMVLFEPSSGGGTLRINSGGVEIVVPYKGKTAPGQTVNGTPMVQELVGMLEVANVPEWIEQRPNGNGFVYLAHVGSQVYVIDGSLTGVSHGEPRWIAQTR